MSQPYKRLTPNIVRRVSEISDFSTGPSSNPDYLRWQAEGGETVTDPADPPPPQFVRQHALGAERQTVDGATPAWQAIFQAPLTEVGTVYIATIDVVGKSEPLADGVVIRGSIGFFRAAGSAVLLGQDRLHSDFVTPGVTTARATNPNAWNARGRVSGTDAVIEIQGQANRTIKWVMRGVFYLADFDGMG